MQRTVTAFTRLIHPLNDKTENRKEDLGMATLLERTRKINKLLQKSESVEYDGISRVLSNVIGANVYIASK